MEKKRNIPYNKILLLGIFVVYCSLRIISWSNATTFEDHDSVSYLQTAKYIEHHQWEKLNPMNTFFYSALIAAFHQFNIKYEISARLISLIFSIVLFFSFYYWGKKITSSKGVLLGLLLLSLNPFLINLSIAVLTEPSYIGLVYSGLFLFGYFIKRDKISIAFLCGLIFGLSFTDRTEGIIFILFIPMMKLLYYLLWEKKNYSIAHLAGWVGVFIIGYSIFSVPSIVYVSSQMGTFSINGRTVWQKLLNSSDIKSYEEKLNGLDFSSSEVNLTYALSHPDFPDKKHENINNDSNFNNKDGLIHFDALKYFILDITKLYRSSLSSVLGVFILIFYGIGIRHLLVKQKYKDILLNIFFTLVVLIPPMMLYGYRYRHIAIVIPAVIILSGIGFKELCSGIVSSIKNEKLYSLLKNKIDLIFIILMIFFSLGWFNDALRHPSQNSEYSLENFKQPLLILKKDIKKNNIKNPKISSRKNYFPYYANIDEFSLPYTDYDKLVNYFRLNDGNYLFLEYQHISNYPFVKNFQDQNTPDFILLYSGYNDKSNKIELYRFKIRESPPNNEVIRKIFK